jgi:hypothetical protein
MQGPSRQTGYSGQCVELLALSLPSIVRSACRERPFGIAP